MNRLFYILSKLLKKSRLSSILNSHIHPKSKVESGSNVVNTSMDRYSFCGYDCELINCDIGAFTSIANGVVIGGGMHPMVWVSMSPVFYEGRDSVRAKFSTHKRPEDRRTIIGDDVWIGSRALIKQGVTVGTGAVIGMGSVVTKDVQPYSIVAGNPAKLIKMRFEENVINELIKSKWWLLNDDELKTNAQFFTDPSQFISNFKK